MILHQLLFGDRTTPASAKAEDEKKERDYIQYIEDMCDTTNIESLLNTKEAIVVPSNYDRAV
jgi:L-alanine-DL-glutamate epimerase-like enolase superfamily enzyme